MKALFEKTERLKLRGKLDELLALQNDEDYIVGLVDKIIGERQAFVMTKLDEPAFFVQRRNPAYLPKDES